MSFNAEWDVDKYKTEYESEEHWQLRRSFMMTHKNKFPEDRLVCLAQVFTNVEFLGCRYPAETMELIGQLSEGVADGYREKQKTKLQRTFIKASDAAGAKVKGLKRPLGDAAGQSDSPPKIPKCADITQLPQINISTTSDTSKISGNIQLPQTTISSTADTPKGVEQKQIPKGVEKKQISKGVEHKLLLQNNISSTTETPKCSETMQLPQKTVSSTAWVVTDTDSSVQSTSVASQLLKTCAFIQAAEPSKMLSKENKQESNDIEINGCEENTKTVREDDRKLTKKEAKTNCKSNSRRLKKDNSKVESYRDLDSEMALIHTGKFGRLILLEAMGESNPLNVLTHSTTHCRIPFRIEYGGKTPFCKVFVNNHLLTTSCGFNRKEARDLAVHDAYEKLTQICYVLKIKSKINADGSVVERDEVRDAKPETGNSVEKPLEENNIGSRLMRAMGWTGGGLGKEQQGIAEPIRVTKQVKRAGLGLGDEKSQNSNSKAQFRKKVLLILQEFANKSEPYDLVFSSEFTKEERATTHVLCQTLGLKSKSYGRNEDRRIVVSHRKDFCKIVEDMLASGQYSNALYELIKPPIALPPENETQAQQCESNVKCENAVASSFEPSVVTPDVSGTSQIPKDQPLSSVAEVTCENVSFDSAKPAEFAVLDSVDGVSQRSADGIAGPFGCLVLIEDETVVTPIQLIERSANGCHIPFKFEYTNVKGGMTCKLFINKTLVASSTEVSKKRAREVTVSRSLEKLKDVCCTLKNQIKMVNDTISVIKCLKKPYKRSVGCGKDSETHIVCVSKEVDWPALGIEHGAKALALVTFKDKVRNFLRKYQTDSCPYDLVFSPEFSAHEKSWIQKIASGLALKTTKYDISKKDYMVISKKLSVIELAKAILTSGGNVSADSIKLENIFIL